MYEKQENDFKIKLVNNEKEVEITGYKSENGYVSIPPRIDNLLVTGIGDKAFTRNGGYIYRAHTR